MKISVIIPVFRVQDTLARCVDSILQQDYGDWEMLLVDDGSDDASPGMCDRYSRSDKRIRTIHQTNQGLGAARNTGIEAATGDCLMFIDSDDYLGNGVMRQLAAVMCGDTTLDLAEFGILREYADGRSERTDYRPRTYNDTSRYFFETRAYLHSYAWNKIYRRRVFDRVRFTPGKKFEDSFTLPHILSVCKKVASTGIGYYHYTDNPKGITATAGTGIADLLEANVLTMQRLAWRRPKGISRGDFAKYYAYVINLQLYVFHKCGDSTVCTKRLILPYTTKLALVAVLGVRNTCRLFKKLYKICRRYQS